MAVDYLLAVQPIQNEELAYCTILHFKFSGPPTSIQADAKNTSSEAQKTDQENFRLYVVSERLNF